MSNQLLPCPFCGHDEPTHDEGDQSAWVQCTNFECGMCGPIASGPSLAAAAWNRRATQPAAGEPAADFFVEFETLRKAMSIYGLAAPASNSELGALMERYAVELIEAVADRPFPAPPAAAPVAAGEPVAPIGYANPKHLARMAAGEMGSVSVLAERSPDENHTAPVFGAPPAAPHGDEAVAVVGTVPDGSGFKSLDFKVDLQDLPDGTKLYAMRAQGDGEVQ